MELNDKEQEIMDHIEKAHRGIHELGLKCNYDELSDATHKLQYFVVMAALQRENPKKWGAWYGLNPSSRP